MSSIGSSRNSSRFQKAGELNLPVGVMPFKGLSQHIEDLEDRNGDMEITEAEQFPEEYTLRYGIIKQRVGTRQVSFGRKDKPTCQRCDA